MQLSLDLLKKVLTNVIYEDPSDGPARVQWGYREECRQKGLDWPKVAHTMIGMRRLDNVQHCLETVLADDIPGDFIETGVWRGGTCIFARGVFAAYDVTDRTVWVADSFEGIPHRATSGYPDDREMRLHEFNEWLAISEKEVRENFEKYGLLDDQVKFLPGWFCETLPDAPIELLSILRLDGDLYESTWDALGNLYPKVSPGGFVIVDDYQIPACRRAVHDYRDRYEINDPIVDIDGSGAFWRRS